MTAPKVYGDQAQIVAVYVTSKNHISSWLVMKKDPQKWNQAKPNPKTKQKTQTKMNKQNQNQIKKLTSTPL